MLDNLIFIHLSAHCYDYALPKNDKVLEVKIFLARGFQFRLDNADLRTEDKLPITSRT